MLKELQVEELIKHIAEHSPSPGGGSASALCGTLGASLVGMFAAFSVNKKAFSSLSEREQNEFNENYQKITDAMNRLMQLMDEDMECYPNILAAFKLPKDTMEEVEVRNASIEAAMLHAIEIPYEIMKVSYSAMKTASNMLRSGNKNVLTDLLGGIIMLNASLESASLNVYINLNEVLNLDIKKQYYDDTTDLVQNAKELKEAIVEAYKPR